MTPAVAPGAVSPPRAYGSLLILSACCFFETLGLGAGTLLVDPIRRDLHLSDLQIALALGTAFGLAYGLSSAPIGVAIDRVRRTGMLFAGIVLWVIAIAAMAFVGGFAALLGLQVVLGAVTALLLPTAISLISDYFPPERRAFAVACIVIGQTLGSATAFLGGGAIFDAFAHGGVAPAPAGAMAPWRLVYLAFALLGALLAPALLLLREPLRREQGAAAGRGLAQSLRELVRYGRFLLPFYLAFTFLAAASNAGALWVAPALSRRFGQPMHVIGFAVGLATAVSGLLGATLGGPLAEFCRTRRLGMMGLAAAAALAAAPCSLFALAPGLASAVIVYGGFACLTAIALLVSSVVLTIVLPNELRGLGTGILVLLGVGAGRGAAPAAIALVLKALPAGAGLAQAIALLAGASLVLAAALFLWGRGGTIAVTTEARAKRRMKS